MDIEKLREANRLLEQIEEAQNALISLKDDNTDIAWEKIRRGFIGTPDHIKQEVINLLFDYYFSRNMAKKSLFDKL